MLLNLCRTILQCIQVYTQYHTFRLFYLQVTSPKQCPLQLYRQSDPNVPIGHSEKKILLDIDQKDDVKYIDIKISFCFLSEIKQSHVKYASLFMEGVNCLHLILVDFSLRPTFESLYNTCAH